MAKQLKDAYTPRLQQHYQDVVREEEELRGCSLEPRPPVPSEVGLEVSDGQVVLIESLAWKAAFLRDTVAQLSLEGRVTIEQVREG